MSGVATSSKSASDAYVIRDIKNKGKGMVAAKNLSPGEVIVDEVPPIVVNITSKKTTLYKAYQSLSDDDRARIDALSFCETPAHVQEFAKLLGRPHDIECGRTIARWETNAMEDRGKFVQYVAPESARMNHSCRPNATYDYSHETGHVVVKALGKISEGTEIVIPYVPPIWTKEARLSYLKEKWGFTCVCEGCTTNPISEGARREMYEAHTKLGEIRGRGRKSNPRQNPDEFQLEEQVPLCYSFLKHSISIISLIPFTLEKLTIYLHMLNVTKRLDTPEAKKFFPEGYRLGRIYGLDDDFVQFCKNVSNSKGWSLGPNS